MVIDLILYTESVCCVVTLLAASGSGVPDTEGRG